MSSRSTCGLGEDFWFVDRLWELAADLPVTTRTVDSFDEWDEVVWEPTLTLRQCAEHLARVRDADESYPIIVAAEGWLMDGAHRLVKAYMAGHPTVAVKQFVVTPPPDFTEARER